MKKGLQRLTETHSKFAHLLKKNKIELSEMNSVLNDEEKKLFGPYLAVMLNEKKGEELDLFLDKISNIIPESVKNQIWESNHYNITVAFSKLLEAEGKMPTKSVIALETGLSRQTVSKHLKDFSSHHLQVETQRKFKFMSDRVLAKVYKMAVIGEGNVKAARLYLETVGALSGVNTPPLTTNNTQNNYIQINGTVLSQDNIKDLTQGQLKIIERIAKEATTHSKILKQHENKF